MVDRRERYDLWAVVTCKGRLSFLQITLPRLLGEPELACCLVDYSCPDQCGSWAEQEFDNEVRAGRLVVERVPGQSTFRRSAALNAGGRRVLGQGARFLLFVDADTLVEPGFGRALRTQARPKRFLIVGAQPNGTQQKELFGVLALGAREYATSGGFDETFVGWGGEDFEYRLRLYLVHGLEFDTLPASLLCSLPHDDALRVQFQHDKDLCHSGRINLARVAARLNTQWRGADRTKLEAVPKLAPGLAWRPVQGARSPAMEPDDGS
jgi:hypothetical protein